MGTLFSGPEKHRWGPLQGGEWCLWHWSSKARGGGGKVGEPGRSPAFWLLDGLKKAGISRILRWFNQEKVGLTCDFRPRMVLTIPIRPIKMGMSMILWVFKFVPRWAWVKAYDFRFYSRGVMNIHNCQLIWSQLQDTKDFGYILWLVVWNMHFIFPYIGNNCRASHTGDAGRGWGRERERGMSSELANMTCWGSAAYLGAMLAQLGAMLAHLEAMLAYAYAHKVL